MYMRVRIRNVCPPPSSHSPSLILKQSTVMLCVSIKYPTFASVSPPSPVFSRTIRRALPPPAFPGYCTSIRRAMLNSTFQSKALTSLLPSPVHSVGFQKPAAVVILWLLPSDLSIQQALVRFPIRLGERVVC